MLEERHARLIVPEELVGGGADQPRTLHEADGRIEQALAQRRVDLRFCKREDVRVLLLAEYWPA